MYTSLLPRSTVIYPVDALSSAFSLGGQGKFKDQRKTEDGQDLSDLVMGRERVCVGGVVD